jgi:hypothetical protein
MPSESQSSKKDIDLLQDLARRVGALERRVMRASIPQRASNASDLMLRWRILQEDRLRDEIAAEERLRRERPDEWRRRDRERVAANQADAGLNRRLRAAGLDPQPARLSLRQKMRKLQRLRAQNLAETEPLRSGK